MLLSHKPYWFFLPTSGQPKQIWILIFVYHLLNKRAVVTKLAWVYHWDMPKRCLGLSNLIIIFKVSIGIGVTISCYTLSSELLGRFLLNLHGYVTGVYYILLAVTSFKIILSGVNYF